MVDTLTSLWLNVGMTKNINQLAVGDRVTAIGDQPMLQPYEVTEIRNVTLKGKTFPAFIILEGGRFWPTGRTDPRTCTIV